jgi:hypothetical protein
MTDQASRRLSGIIFVVALAAAGGAWALAQGRTETTAAAGPRQTFPQPTADPGPVRIAGSVNVANVPHVLSEQLGEWTVSLAGQPSVHLSGRPTVTMGGPVFLETDREYRFVWADGQAETYRVLGAEADGWVRGEAIAGEAPRVQRWINPQQARTIEETPQTRR